MTELTPELRALVDAQLASGRFQNEEQVVAAALLLLEDAAPGDNVGARTGAVDELARLKGVHEVLQRAKMERDFVITLARRQREIRHPEAITQMTAELLGARLQVQRVGFFRTAGEGLLDLGACWTDGGLRPLHGAVQTVHLGLGALLMLRDGEAVVTENCHTDPAVDGAFLAEIGAIAMISAPVMRDRAWEGGLYVHNCEPRPWTVAERLLVQEVAELTWDAVERATLLNQLRGEIGEQRGELTRAADALNAQIAGRVAAESQVTQLQRMELVGQLTGGIAHDFNNMLAVIIGGLNLLQRRLARGETDVAKYVDAAMDGAARAAALTHRLLAFSRRQPLAPEPIDANRMIGGMEDLLARTLGEDIGVETVMSPGVWTIKADVSQLENAVLNLAVNARDAMAGGGRLTIETANVSVDEAYARHNDVAVGQYVLIAVSDTGAGMAPAVLERVFEPFFTTKAVGKGTGLGLSQVFGFARQSNGAVKLYSEVDQGTTVKLYLPRHYGGAEPAVVRGEDVAEAPRGDPREIILVVEDEPRVQALTVDTLRDLGYSVLHASSGPEALTVLESPQDVSLLFTDIVMPEMTGRQLVDAALKVRPALKVVYTTGYTRNAVVHNGVLDPGTHLLPKPFSVERLASLIRTVLDVGAKG